MIELTIQDSFDQYLDSVALARSANTARTYRNAINAFKESLLVNELDPGNDHLGMVDENWITEFISYLRHYAPSSERLYLSAVAGWFEFIAAENYAEINLPRIQTLIQRRARRPGQRLPQFPRGSIELMVNYAINLINIGTEDDRERMRNLRDRAFILSLADTGMRVHEACQLRRGDVDWAESRAILIGKGDRQAVVRFSGRSLKAVKEYLSGRAPLDGATGRSLGALPLFARHDKGAGSRVVPISTTTGRTIIRQRAREALDDESAELITPHSFRHYFVTTVLRGSGGNLKLAQELARHKSIAVTQRYAHLSDDELDRGYFEIFET
jgi:site-specific recombinase XerD